MSDSPKDYKMMLKGELLGVARRLGLTNLSRLRKAEIVDLIRRATRQNAERKAAKSSTKASSNSSARSKTVSSSKTSATKKSATKKATAKKATAKKAATKKAAAKKATAKKATAKSSTGKAGARSKKATTNDNATTASSTKVKATSKSATGAARSRSRKAEPADVAAGSRKKKTASNAAGPKRVRTYRRKVVPAAKAPARAAATKSPARAAAADEYEPAELAGLDQGLPQLPETQPDNRIVLLPRDPAWLFAYWSLTSEYKEAARAAGGQVLALRLHDVTGVDFDGANALGTYEHECAEWARSWYVPVPAPGRDYLVEIGYRGGGDWFPLARSQRVTAPADQPSTWVQEESVTIDFDEDLRALRNRLPELQAPTEPPTALPLTMQTIFDDGDLRIVAGGQALNPSGMPHWPPASQVLAAPGGVPGSLGHVPASLGHVPASLGHVPASLGHVPGSLGQLPGSLGYLPASLGELGQLMRHPGTGEGGALGLGPDGRVFAGRPLMLEQGEQPMLQAAVELVISGRSYPGAELTVAGQRVPTGPDGAFSLRVSVPDGLRDLPIEARSAETGVSRRLVVRLGRELEQ